ncbi:MAG: NAD(+)/NADH kinase [Anaerolineae bacterium]|nr:NAD(+)/NADH kinase [Anaerolineae bacterium]
MSKEYSCEEKMAVEQTFQRVAVVSGANVPEAGPLAGEIMDYLRETGLGVIGAELGDDKLAQQVSAGEIDLVITLGGDGTVLRAGHLCAPFDVPILAINLGRFGFLIEIWPDGWQKALDNLLSGEYWYERRMMLRTEQWRGGACLGKWEVLNEAMIGRGEIARPVRLVTRLDGRPLTTYVADGLLVSTATGSTAYALAAGGPILPPEMRNILVVPIAPHLSVDRAIVLAEGSTISVIVRCDHRVVLSVDGQLPVDLVDGDRVEVCGSDHSVRFVRFQDPGYFYRHLITLMDQNPSAGDLV